MTRHETESRRYARSEARPTSRQTSTFMSAVAPECSSRSLTGLGICRERKPTRTGGADLKNLIAVPVLTPLDADAVRAFAAGKLAHYRIPRYVHVVDEFPMTVTGKVRKVEMREETVKLLGL